MNNVETQNFVARCMASKKSDQYPIDFTKTEVLAGLAWQVKNGRCELEGDSLDRHSVRLMAWECRQGRLESYRRKEA